LEALSGSQKEAHVIRRVQGFAQSPDAEYKLKRLYLNRHWFVHGIDVPAMGDIAARDESLDEGIVVTKEIVRSALMDDTFFEAAFGKARAVAKYLDERSL
jgi:hypothetical protein